MELQIRKLTLEERVHKALDKAVVRGFADAISTMTEAEIALDLMLFDADLKNDRSQIDLVPFVQSWRAKL
jgi:hypothetical protein